MAFIYSHPFIPICQSHSQSQSQCPSLPHDSKSRPSVFFSFELRVLRCPYVRVLHICGLVSGGFMHPSFVPLWINSGSWGRRWWFGWEGLAFPPRYPFLYVPFVLSFLYPASCSPKSFTLTCPAMSTPSYTSAHGFSSDFRLGLGHATFEFWGEADSMTAFSQ
jgi:hypothetical protein